MKRIAILGSTGSIGRSTLSVAESYPDRFQIVALAAGSNLEAAFEQARRWRPRVISIAAEARCRPAALASEASRPERNRGGSRSGRNGEGCDSSGRRFRGQRHRGRGRAGGHLRSGEGRKDRRRGQQGMSGRSGRVDYGRGAPPRASRCCRSTASTTPCTNACAADGWRKWSASG